MQPACCVCTHNEIFTNPNFSVFTSKIERVFPLFRKRSQIAFVRPTVSDLARSPQHTSSSASPHRIQCVFFIAISTAIEFVFLFRNALGTLFFQRRCIVSKGFRVLSGFGPSIISIGFFRWKSLLKYKCSKFLFLRCDFQNELAN